MTHHTHCLGFPRMGRNRQLKWLLEKYWRGQVDRDALLTGAAELRQEHWQLQRDAGLSLLTCGDFSLYDSVLDTAQALGAVPARFANIEDPLEQYFAMARGNDSSAACAMTKWFNTNYHYLVPELEPGQTFAPGQSPAASQLAEAPQGSRKAVLLGPVSFLYLARTQAENFRPLDLLDELLPAYRQLLSQLKEADWVQLDEPILVLDLDADWRAAIEKSMSALAGAGPKLLLTTYFGRLERQLDFCLQLPVDGLHLDALNSGDELERAAAAIGPDKVLSAGIVNGRNIWRADLAKCMARLRPLADQLGERLWVGSSCSLLHSPVDLSDETQLDDELKNWLAFGVQKLSEITLIGKGLADPTDPEVVQAVEASSRAVEQHTRSNRVHKDEVAKRLAAVSKADLERPDPYPKRQQLQHQALGLPDFPTTTIGSFPQTNEIRSCRLRYRRGEIDDQEYMQAMRAEISHVIREQEELGLDVLVHGEPERNDMVEYFGELLEGMATTANGWVQSYGSRCVKPPVIYGDIDRPEPMTVEWLQYAQQQTEKPVKGMLTGPVTMLCWSFPREDVSLGESARQIALALRDEVADLERAGLKAVQIDEPALREGLPLREVDRAEYFAWAIESFRLSSAGAHSQTQIHSHMCYAQFNDIIEQIIALDPDVISMETSRSNMELLKAFSDREYPNEIGPGVYDIHSPRVPDEAWMHSLMQRACEVVDPKKLWVNPDCGLKTRRWEEIRPAIRNMVATARRLREQTST